MGIIVAFKPLISVFKQSAISFTVIWLKHEDKSTYLIFEKKGLSFLFSKLRTLTLPVELFGKDCGCDRCSINDCVRGTDDDETEDVRRWL
jgi:hypothetical protein